MSEALQPPDEGDDETFEEWVDRRRDQLERHAEKGYESSEIAQAFLDYVDEEGSP